MKKIIHIIILLLTYAFAYSQRTITGTFPGLANQQVKLSSFEGLNMNGKLLQNEKNIGNQTSIVMNHLVPATYFIKVIQGNKEVKAFKVIKK